MTWLNPPLSVTGTIDTRLTATTLPNTDFWRVTRHDFIADNGHLLAAPTRGDFTFTASFSAPLAAQYDQVGVMWRASEQLWVKAGLELLDGVPVPSVVVTRGESDWSVIPTGLRGLLRPALAPDEQGVLAASFRMTRIGSALEVSALFQDGWKLLRQAFVGLEGGQAGVLLASPKGAGLQATFWDVTLEQPAQ